MYDISFQPCPNQQQERNSSKCFLFENNQCQKMEEEFKFPSNWGLPEKWSIWPLNMQFAAWPCPAFILLFLCEQSVNRNMWSLIVILQVPNITQWTFWILTKQNSLNFDLISDFLSGYYKHWQTRLTVPRYLGTLPPIPSQSQ